MQSTALKSVIGIVLAAAFSWVVYYGTYLPMRKSQTFIASMRELRSVSSVEEFRNIASRSLELPSPIGQEELVRNTANVVLSAVNGTDNPDIIAGMVGFIEEHYQPIIAREKGMSFGQNLYLMGAISEAAFIKTREQRYFDAAKRYYGTALEHGPKRPQALYGMFDIYRMEGNVEKAVEIANQILEQWPGDERARRGIEDFLQRMEEFNLQRQ